MAQIKILKQKRQAIRNEINCIMGMSDEEYYEAYPEELEEIDIIDEDIEEGDYI